MTAPVFLCPAASKATVGEPLALDGAEARHAGTVQRRAAGEVLDLVDGHGRRARGPIVEVAEGRVTIRVEEVLEDRDPAVTLVQALAKGGRDEQAVESAVELGITTVVPWQADRSIVQWRGPKAEKARAKWDALALAAMKQSRRAVLPTVDPVVTTRGLVARVREAVAAGERVLVLHEVAAQPLTSLSWDDASQPVTFIVGPEGGVSDDEVAALVDAGAEAVLLGPHVLRASTAGPAGITALAALRRTW
ncbi:16S rRNA (uracil(1498)-N(3))-methyltransferase [Demequina sp. NBRC 110054]|uniref:16S rRNA (uracil(1498)-N(3))-methyltransferase n=1 Tax=Demequina sp. NBRC 110054 TaxID=1570343 RepID=UPI000A0588B7|nr:16S rRNA (uracil(1498)-N(3))-methyltransferase [Demequina sp. NBRC 110054]